MDRKGQEDYFKIIGAAFVALVAISFISIGIAIFRDATAPCPICDCSSFSNNLSICISNLNNLSLELEQRPIINNTLYAPIYTEVSNFEIWSSSITISISLVLSFLLSLGLTLFKFEIELPEEWKQHIAKMKKTLMWFKIASWLVFALLLLKFAILIWTITRI